MTPRVEQKQQHLCEEVFRYTCSWTSEQSLSDFSQVVSQKRPHAGRLSSLWRRRLLLLVIIFLFYLFVVLLMGIQSLHVCFHNSDHCHTSCRSCPRLSRAQPHPVGLQSNTFLIKYD